MAPHVHTQGAICWVKLILLFYLFFTGPLWESNQGPSDCGSDVLPLSYWGFLVWESALHYIWMLVYSLQIFPIPNLIDLSACLRNDGEIATVAGPTVPQVYSLQFFPIPNPIDLSACLRNDGEFATPGRQSLLLCKTRRSGSTTTYSDQKKWRNLFQSLSLPAFHFPAISSTVNIMQNIIWTRICLKIHQNVVFRTGFQKIYNLPPFPSQNFTGQKSLEIKNISQSLSGPLVGRVVYKRVRTSCRVQLTP